MQYNVYLPFPLVLLRCDYQEHTLKEMFLLQFPRRYVCLQYLIQLTAHVTRNIYFVMLFLYVTASIGHHEGGQLHRKDISVTNAVKDVCI
jgi:hypothetical protein